MHYRAPETGKEYAFLTNRLEMSALEVAELYRRLWQVQLFFKWIKQNLKIKAFYGTSKNAVLIQIGTALIAYLLLVWVKFKTKAGRGLLEITRLTQTMLWNVWTCGPCLVFVHQITDNPCYSISVPDTSVFRFNIPDNYHSILSLIGLLKSNKPV